MKCLPLNKAKILTLISGINSKFRIKDGDQSVNPHTNIHEGTYVLYLEPYIQGGA